MPKGLERTPLVVIDLGIAVAIGMGSSNCEAEPPCALLQLSRTNEALSPGR